MQRPSPRLDRVSSRLGPTTGWCPRYGLRRTVTSIPLASPIEDNTWPRSLVACRLVGDRRDGCPESSHRVVVFRVLQDGLAPAPQRWRSSHYCERLLQGRLMRQPSVVVGCPAPEVGEAPSVVRASGWPTVPQSSGLRRCLIRTARQAGRRCRSCRRSGTPGRPRDRNRASASPGVSTLALTLPPGGPERGLLYRARHEPISGSKSACTESWPRSDLRAPPVRLARCHHGARRSSDAPANVARSIFRGPSCPISSLARARCAGFARLVWRSDSRAHRAKRRIALADRFARHRVGGPPSHAFRRRRKRRIADPRAPSDFATIRLPAANASGAAVRNAGRSGKSERCVADIRGARRAPRHVRLDETGLRRSVAACGSTARHCGEIFGDWRRPGRTLFGMLAPSVHRRGLSGIAGIGRFPNSGTRHDIGALHRRIERHHEIGQPGSRFVNGQLDLGTAVHLERAAHAPYVA